MDPPQLPSTGSDTGPEVLDDAFLALRDRTRRYVCYFLLEHGTASLSEVADVITGWIHATDGGIVEPQCRTNQYSNLVHTHVPRLVETGVVRHDEETETLSLDSCPELVRDVIARACEAETGT
ncbi:DUF7344 domain-containing protein [Natronorubrum tibetense]|uniref:DUF7344 domain-containing protein n=1 Tax=Natronorubrum tibetense GA33 TaxID=1114856 RepID=L9VYK3_9EURY|nr:hypothetical protein [Natronorubrum tibetense]ELY42275.1 hypothetical protein C496_07748 [Natronorubrum tibetense GA33]